MCARAPDGQAATANAHAQYIHKVTTTALHHGKRLTVSTDILSTDQTSIVMSDKPLSPADHMQIQNNNFSLEQYLFMCEAHRETVEYWLRGLFLRLQDERPENEKFVKKMGSIMEVDQGNRNICVTCAFLSMLCMQLRDLGIDVSATSLLQQMDTAGATWLKETGAQPTIAELENFMKNQWFTSTDGKMFRVSIAMSVCFNSQCTIPERERNPRDQTSYNNRLLEHIRECHSRTKFVIGIVNILPVFVNGKRMSTDKILHQQIHNMGHALGLFSTDRTFVKGWNSWSNQSKVVTLKPSYVHAFIVVNMIKLEVQDSAQRVTELMHAQAEETDWFVHSTPYSDIEDQILSSWLELDKLVYSYQGKRPNVREYALVPRLQTAAKQAIKRPPAQADDPDSTHGQQKRRKRMNK